MQVKTESQQQIVDQDWLVQEQKESVKETQKDLDDLIDSKPEKQTVDRLEDQLRIAKEDLKRAELNDSQIVETKEILANQKTELKIRRSVLSTLLVHYVAEHKVQSIEIEESNREIKVNAKIGKRLKEQMELPL